MGSSCLYGIFEVSGHVLTFFISLWNIREIMRKEKQFLLHLYKSLVQVMSKERFAWKIQFLLVACAFHFLHQAWIAIIDGQVIGLKKCVHDLRNKKVKELDLFSMFYKIWQWLATSCAQKRNYHLSRSPAHTFLSLEAYTFTIARRYKMEIMNKTRIFSFDLLH